MRAVLLVHGAWCGAWVWSSLQAELASQNVPSFAIDLPGHGASLLPFSSSLHEDAQFVADTIAALSKKGVENPVLVGHSYGGTVITQAAILNPAVSQLVYLSATCPNMGENASGAEHAISEWTPHPANGFGSHITVSADGTCYLNPEGASFMLGKLEGSMRNLANVAVSSLGRHPLATFGGEGVSGDPRATIPSTYIVSTQDEVLLTANQRNLSARCAATLEVDAAHMPQITKPKQLAALIKQIIAA